MDKVVVTDEALVEAIRTKDQEQYAEIVSRYQERLFRYALYLVHDSEKARDVVQNALIKAFINLNGFDTKKRFSTWIYRIVHNEAMNEVGKYKRIVELPDEYDMPSDEDLGDHITYKEEQRLVKTCFTHLPVLYAEPLSLNFLEDKSYEEISEILRIPIGTVKTRIRRAKLLMRKLCQSKQLM